MEITEPGVYEMTDAETDNVRKVPVGPSGHHALIDEDDWKIVRRFQWNLLRGHAGKLYAYTSDGIYMHRLLAGTPKGIETDHINGDGLDNRRSNLRWATPSQNSANVWKPRRPDGRRHSSRFKGVSWDRSRGKWQAKITVAGVCCNLGRYELERDAALAYDVAAKAAWGDYAALNIAGAVAE